MLVCVPFARLNLDDNMAFQWLSAIAQLGFSFVFAAQFIFNILPGSPNYCEGNGPGRTPFVGVDFTQVGEQGGSVGGEMLADTERFNPKRNVQDSDHVTERGL